MEERKREEIHQMRLKQIAAEESIRSSFFFCVIYLGTKEEEEESSLEEEWKRRGSGCKSCPITCRGKSHTHILTLSHAKNKIVLLYLASLLLFFTQCANRKKSCKICDKTVSNSSKNRRKEPLFLAAHGFYFPTRRKCKI